MEAEFVDVALDQFLARRGAYILVVTRHGDARQSGGILGQGLYIYSSGDIRAAMTDVHSNLHAVAIDVLALCQGKCSYLSCNRFLHEFGNVLNQQLAFQSRSLQSIGEHDVVFRTRHHQVTNSIQTGGLAPPAFAGARVRLASLFHPDTTTASATAEALPTGT